LASLPPEVTLSHHKASLPVGLFEVDPDFWTAQ
jgi:hypothetical protein